MIFELWRGQENLVVNNKDSRRLKSLNYRSDSCPLMFLKLAYLPSKGRFSPVNICFKNIKFPRGNYQPIIPRRQKHSIA